LPTARSDVRALLKRPATWHYASLAVAGVLILVLQTGQWFFFDEWSFLEPHGAGLFDAHVGHWSTSPNLVYNALVAVFGLHSYLPFAFLMTVMHLLAAHLIWRITIAVGVEGWIAVAATTVFLVFGTGAENILWAFQIGFVGAVVLGLWAFLLALRPQASALRFVAILAISLFSLTWSGTSIPLVVATAALLLARSGWRRALIYTVTTAGVYLVWWVIYASQSGPYNGGIGWYKFTVLIPQFLGVMLILGFGDVFPAPGLGFLLLVAVAVWLIVLVVRKRRLPGALPAVILLAAAALFAFMTAYSRAALSVGSARSSRYIYLIVLLMLPILALAISRLAARWRHGVPVAVALLVALAGYQTFLLVTAAQAQSEREQSTQRLLSAALILYNEGEPVDPLRGPDPRWAPDILMSDLIELYEDGLITIVPVTEDDLEQAREYVVP
jgi:hypothetical protein